MVITRFFDMSYKPFVGWSLIMVVATTLLVVEVGLLSSVSVLSRMPAAFLREQTDE